MLNTSDIYSYPIHKAQAWCRVPITHLTFLSSRQKDVHPPVTIGTER